jgi:hypothetical protein
MKTRFRTGTKLGRTIYLIQDEEDISKDDFMGIMDDPAFAEVVVQALNEYFARKGK